MSVATTDIAVAMLANRIARVFTDVPITIQPDPDGILLARIVIEGRSPRDHAAAAADSLVYPLPTTERHRVDGQDGEGDGIAVVTTTTGLHHRGQIEVRVVTIQRHPAVHDLTDPDPAVRDRLLDAFHDPDEVRWEHAGHWLATRRAEHPIEVDGDGQPVGDLRITTITVWHLSEMRPDDWDVIEGKSPREIEEYRAWEREANR